MQYARSTPNLLFRAGVGVLVGLLDLFEGGVGIDLRGGETGVAEQGLDSADIRTVIEHRGGKSMSQDMRGMFLQG